ncbi:MAG: ArsA family ATPase [Sandaracinaceae bacterium]
MSGAIEAPLLDEPRLLVCVGPGGVGKTTVAAALAVTAAQRGRRVALLTIDPAKRLADALGQGGLDDQLRPVPGPLEDRLDAAMIDTPSSYDTLIAQVTEDDEEARQRILDNRVYRSFRQSMARSHAYVAMERLHRTLAAEEHDLVVLATPPTRNALEILDAPGRLTRFLDERVLRAFVGRSRGSRSGTWLKETGSAVALRLFGLLAGSELVEELAAFFDAFLDLRPGFVERAERMRAELRAPDTSFILVTAPEAVPLADAAFLRDGLEERGVDLAAVILNRSYHPGVDGGPLATAPPLDPAGVTTRLGLAEEPRAVAEVLRAARALREERRADNRERARAQAGFLARADRRVPSAYMLPFVDPAPGDLQSLADLLQAGHPASVRDR